VLISTLINTIYREFEQLLLRIWLQKWKRGKWKKEYLSCMKR